MAGRAKRNAETFLWPFRIATLSLLWQPTENKGREGIKLAERKKEKGRNEGKRKADCPSYLSCQDQGLYTIKPH